MKPALLTLWKGIPFHAFTPKLIILRQKLFLFFVFLLFFSVAIRAQQWPVLANEQQISTQASSYTSIAIITDGAATIPHVAYTELGIVKVKKYTGEEWELVGGNVSDGSASFSRIYADSDDNLYVTYVDGTNANRLAIKKFNTSTNAWEPLNGNAANLLVSDATVTFSISQFNATPRSALAFDSNNMPYVIYAEGSGLNPFVKRFNGTDWETVGAAPISAHRAIGVSIAVDNNNIPYIIYANTPAGSTVGTITIYRYVDEAWQPITVPAGTGSSATTAARHTNISFTSDWNPVISYFNASNSNRATILRYNLSNSTWSSPSVLSARDISQNSLTRGASGNLYASFADAYSNGSGRTVARVFQLPSGGSSWTELTNAPVVNGIDEPVGNLSLGVDINSRPYISYTKTNSSGVVTPIVRAFSNAAPPPPPPPPPPPVDEVVTTPKQIERLDRGTVAIRTSSNEVYIGWRFFGTDPSGIAFNVYRNSIKINTTPITGSTNFIDHTEENGVYTVRPIINGIEQPASRPVSIWQQNFLDIPLQRPAGGTTPDGVSYTYSPNDCAVGDVDGDGQYEIILKWDPSNAKDNSQAGYTGNVFIDAYKLDGTRLWRIDLGRNIRAGAHYTQFMVYDLDGDGKAEIACKTADGTVDGKGITLGDPLADYRNANGYILSGPEFLTIFNGETGAAMATTNYLPARGTVSLWGDSYGNRVDRFIAAIAYLDGARPSLIMGRGYYTRLVRVAWDWRNGELKHRWTFDSNESGNNLYAGQGNHQMTVGDVDGDGKDEVFNGSSAINDNGKGLWTNRLGHGDALHLSNMDPDSEVQEIWQPYESPSSNGNVGAALINAKTGERIFTVAETSADVGRGLAADIDPRYKGYEMWASRGNLYNAKGLQIGARKPSMNFAIWWDGDLQRELLDGITVSKWDYNAGSASPLLVATGCSSNNSTKANPGLSADILGDWREEVIFRTSDNNSLRIYSTTIPTEHRIYTLMHDPQYRVAIAWQNSGYNQPPHPSFYLGEEMTLPTPNIEYVKDVIAPVAKAKNITVILSAGSATIAPEDVNDGSYDAFGIGTLSLNKTVFNCNDIGENKVTLTVTDVNGNAASVDAIVTVVGSIPNNPQLLVTRNDHTYTGASANTIFLGYGAQSLQLLATNSAEEGVMNYSWSPATGLNDAAITNPVFAPTQAGSVTFTAMATNSYGCTASSQITIHVLDARCGENNDKVLVCHNGETICVAAASVEAHLIHGCSIALCSTISASSFGKQLYGLDQYTDGTSSLSISPNPAYGQARISFKLANKGRYTLELYDATGKRLEVLASGEQDAKSIVVMDLNTTKYSKGLYLIKLSTGSELLTERIIIQ